MISITTKQQVLSVLKVMEVAIDVATPACIGDLIESFAVDFKTIKESEFAGDKDVLAALEGVRLSVEGQVQYATGELASQLHRIVRAHSTGSAFIEFVDPKGELAVFAILDFADPNYLGVVDSINMKVEELASEKPETKFGVH